MKPIFYVSPVSQGYELRQEGTDGATLFANEASAMWAASAMCLRTGGKIVVRNAKGETMSTRRVHGTR